MFQVVSLEKFRSLQDKLLLLDLAVSAHDGNAITAVNIFTLFSVNSIDKWNSWQHSVSFRFSSIWRGHSVKVSLVQTLDWSNLVQGWSHLVQDQSMVCVDPLFSYVELLFRVLESRQTALRHFIQYLTEIQDQKLLLELFRSVPVSTCINSITCVHLYCLSPPADIHFCLSSELLVGPMTWRYVEHTADTLVVSV